MFNSIDGTIHQTFSGLPRFLGYCYKCDKQNKCDKPSIRKIGNGCVRLRLICVISSDVTTFGQRPANIFFCGKFGNRS